MFFRKNKKLILAALLIVFTTGIFFILFNDLGVIKYFKLKNEVEEINKQIEAIDSENRKIENEIDSLEKKIPAKIEKTAREKYDMLRPGETKIQVQQK